MRGESEEAFFSVDLPRAVDLCGKRGRHALSYYSLAVPVSAAKLARRLFVAASAAAAAVAAPPVSRGATFWASQPVGPNGTVLVTGGPWAVDEPLLVQVVRLCDAPPAFVDPPLSPVALYDAVDACTAATLVNATLLLQTASSLTFVLPPAAAPGAFAFHVLSLAGYVPAGGAGPWWWPSSSSPPDVVARFSTLNVPDVWFAQGDLASAASIGGYVAVYGTAMAVPGAPASAPAPSLALVNAATRAVLPLSVPAPATPAGEWAQAFVVPAGTPSGEYELYAHGGCGGPWGWSALAVRLGSSTVRTIAIRPHPRDAWPSVVYDLAAMPGATPDARFAAALAAATASHGGVVYVPAGEFNLTAGLNIPPQTVIRGAGRGATALVWQLLPKAGVAVTGDAFAVEDLSIRAPLLLVSVNATTTTEEAPSTDSSSVAAAGATGDAAGAGGRPRGLAFAYPGVCGVTIFKKAVGGRNITLLSRVTLAAPTPAEAASDAPCSRNASTHVTTMTIAVDVSGAENVVLDDVVMEDVTDGLYVEAASNHTRVVGGSVRFRDAPVLVRCGRSHVYQSLSQHFIGNATIDGLLTDGWQPGPLFGEYCPTSMTRDVAFLNISSTSDQALYNQNTVCDGKEGWYVGGVQAVDSSGVELALAGPLRVPVFQNMTAPPAPPGFDLSTLVGSVVIVTAGRGAGQVRALAGASRGDGARGAVTLDRPFDVAPDATSWLAVTKMKGRMIAAGNNFAAEGIHMFPWCATGEIIYADSRLGAVFTDPSGGTAMPPNKVGVPVAWTYVSCWRYLDPDDAAFPGFLSGSWYSQALNNTVIAPSTGAALSFSGAPPAGSTPPPFGGEVMFGNVVRGNANAGAGAGGVPFSVSLGPFAGASVVERNDGLTDIYFDITGSVAAVLRGNTNGNATRPLYSCGHEAAVRRCGGDARNATADCHSVCGPAALVIP